MRFFVKSEVIAAHRCVLAALSPTFKDQFYGNVLGTVNIRHVTPAAYREFLQFFYTEKVTLTIDNVEEVMNLASQKLVVDLVNKCAEFLLHAVGLDKLCWCYQIAIAHKIPKLQYFCEEHISANIKEIFKTSDFLNCNCDMLCQIISLDSLNCKETEVFNACILWAQEQCKRRKNNFESLSNLREVLGNAFFKIRFSTMTHEEFAAIHKSYSELFTESQSNEVFHIIGNVKNAKSNVFNNKPRTPKAVTSKIFKADAIKICRIAKTDPSENATMHSSNKCDKIAFVCDKSIRLYGFVIRNQISENLIVNVEVGSRYLPDYSYTVQETSTENACAVNSFCEITIIFKRPIEILSNERCFINLKYDTFNLSLLRKFFLVDEVLQDGVWFQILNPKMSNLHDPKQISELYFNLVEDK